MANVLQSPFASSSGAQRLPALQVGEHGRLIIRLEGSTTDKILFRINSEADVSATRADGFLLAGESIEIRGRVLQGGLASNITVIATSGTANVYFGVV